MIASAGLLPLGCTTSGHNAAAIDIPSDVPVAELDTLIPRSMEEFHVPGVSIAIIKDARLRWRRAYGVRDNASKAPVDHDTVFEAASVSKTVFAYAVLKLCEKGVIDLDTPLVKYDPPTFLTGDPRINQITARHVLSHTTGLPDWRSGQAPLKIQATPGETFSYSGEGYYFLQSVVTRMTGHTDPAHCSQYEDGVKVCATNIDGWLKKNLLLPFGMKASGYVWNKHFARHAARPHGADGSPLEKAKPSAADAARYASAGGLHTTPGDYAKFLIEILASKNGDVFRLGPENLKAMFRPQIKVDENNSWALGWRIYHTKRGDVFMHGGNQTGFHALAIGSLERKTGCIIMTNGDLGWKLINQVFEQVMERYISG